jgi:hypothetical protein
VLELRLRRLREKTQRIQSLCGLGNGGQIDQFQQRISEFDTMNLMNPDDQCQADTINFSAGDRLDGTQETCIR